jgi:Phosphoglycerate dehydrogenase and related dehydrogenases
MQNKPIIVNVEVVAILCENILANVLESGKLKGASIDVFEKETLSSEIRI